MNQLLITYDQLHFQEPLMNVFRIKENDHDNQFWNQLHEHFMIINTM